MSRIDSSVTEVTYELEAEMSHDQALSMSAVVMYATDPAESWPKMFS